MGIRRLKNFATKRVQRVLTALFAISLTTAAEAQGAGSVPMTYSGRLTESTGAPKDGPVAMEATFWTAELDGTQLGQTFEFASVILNQGVFSLYFPFMASQVQDIFRDGTEPVFIEISSGGKAYPRQKFSYIPLAMRVPVDGKSVGFDITSGKLGITGVKDAASGSVLVSNGAGGTKWDNLSSANFIAKTQTGGEPIVDQVLTYKNGKWIAASLPPAAASGNTNLATDVSGSLGVANGGTGATNFTANGVVLGNGSSNLLTTAAGNADQVLRVPADGGVPSFGAMSLASSSAVSGVLPLANGGTGVDLSGTGGAGQFLKQSSTGATVSVATISASEIPSLPATKIPQASNTAGGYLSSTDWSTFSAKQNALGYTPVNKAGDTMSGAIDMNGNAIANVGNLRMASDKTFGLGRFDNASESVMIGTLNTDGAGSPDKGKTWFNTTTNEIKYWDGSMAKSLGISGAGLTNLGGVTASTQSFGTSTSGNTLGFTPIGTVHTLNIPMASGGAGVAAGLISNSDYAAFSNKVSGVAAGSGIAVVPASGTVTVSLSNTTVTPGTYARANITVDAQGRITEAQSASPIADADIAAAANIAQTKIAGLGASLASKETAITVGTTSEYWRGDKTWQALTTAAVPESGTALYYSDVRARSSVSGFAPLNYSVTTGVISLAQGNGSISGYLSSSDWTTFNSKQNALGYAPLNKVGDTMGGALDMGTQKIANLATPTAASDAVNKAYADTKLGGRTLDVGAPSAGQVIKWDQTNQKFYLDADQIGTSGGGIASLNSLTGTSQSIVTSTAGATLGVASSGSTHTINIPMASVNGAAGGLVSNTDYVSFGNKVANVAQGAGIAVSTTSGTATVGLATVGTAGNYTKVTTDTYGRVTAGNSLTASDLPPHSAGLITSGTVNVANGGTGATSLSANNVILGNGTSPLQVVAPGTSGNVLTSNGTTWQSTALPSTNWAVPGTIGSTTPNTGVFTSVTSTAQAGYEARPYGTSEGNTGEVRFDELTANGPNYVAFKAPDVLASSTTWVLPASDGAAGQVLRTDGAGNLGWISGVAPTGAASGDLSGNYPSPSVATVGTKTASAIATAVNDTVAATNLSTASTIVKRDASGNFSTGTISGTLNGNATNVSGTVAIANGGTGATTASASFDALSPLTTIGDILYAGASGADTRLPGNAASTKQFLSSTGTGSAANAPVWAALTASDIPAHSASLITSGVLGVANGGTGAATTSANYVFAGPTTGTGAAAFRSLVAGDLPAMGGANGTTAGTAGAVPGPAAADNLKFLRGDGTWATPAAGAAGSTNQIQYNSGGVLTGNANFVYSGGNVGIGTTIPGATLDVNGTIRMDGAASGYLGLKAPATVSTPVTFTMPNGDGTNGQYLYTNGSGTLSWGTVSSGALLGSYSSTTAVSNYSIGFTGAANSAPSLSGTTLNLASNTSYIVVEMWGGGGGGGAGGSVTNSYPGAGGGGSGGYVKKSIVSPSGTYYFTIGAGGAASASGSNSCFGTNSTACTSPMITAGGGVAGGANDGSNAGNGGAGGSASGGEINAAGGGGAAGTLGQPSVTNGAGGVGGSAPNGGGGGAGRGGTCTVGIAGSSPGGGGSGGGGGCGALGLAGGAGAAGGIVVYAYSVGSPATVAASGSGSTNYVPAFTSSTALGNSPIAVNAGNVGIGTTNPSSTLAVNGDVNTGGGGVKWKTYSGTTSSSAGTTFNHGLDATKIISLQCSIYVSSEGYYYNMTYTIPGILDARTRWNSTNINIMNDYSNTFNQLYRCIAIYIP